MNQLPEDVEQEIPSTSYVNHSVDAFHKIGQYLGFEPGTGCNSLLKKRPQFIALDVEFNPAGTTQLGISIFDPWSLIVPELGDFISMEYPISSTLYATKVSRYKQWRRKPSHFGKCLVLDLLELRALFEDILAPMDTEGRQRDVILVGHMVLSDILEIKRSCGLDVSALPSIKGIMDTQRISHFVLNPRVRLSLRALLIELGLKYVGLHNPAHDSRYALRALLLMACKVHDLNNVNQGRLDSRRKQLELVEQIARFHQRRQPILWCFNSPRVKHEGDCNLLDKIGDSDRDNTNVLGNLFEIA